MNNCFLAPLVGDTDLLTKVKSLELGAFETNSALISCTYSLDAVLEAVYEVRCPEPYEHENRRDLIRIFNVIAKEIYGNGCPVVVEFGSFVMNMFSSDSDLDLSINFNNHAADLSKKERVNALRRFANKFRKLQSRGLVKDVRLVPTARVPVLKVTDQGTNIECDFSVENRDGITKSHIVFIIATIDERLRKLSIMLKAWAKAHSINSSKDGTLNSFSLILLAAFHLQCTEPPILPPFSAFFKDGLDPPTVKKNVASYMNYGEKNKESLIQLFVTLLIRLKSAETLWDEGLCVSVYEGSWIYKRFKNKLGISVEDFTDRSQNVARALHAKKVCDVYQSIDKSLTQIQNFVDGKIKWQHLEKILFGPRPSRMTKKVVTLESAPRHPVSLHKKEIQMAQKKEGNSAPSKDGVLHDHTPTKETQLAPKNEGVLSPCKGDTRARDESAPRHPILHDPIPTKKMRLTEKKKRNKKKKVTTASSESNKNQQSSKEILRPRTGETFDRRASYASHQNPCMYMQRAEERRADETRFAPPVAHEASSSQSFVACPSTLPYIPFDPSFPLHPPPQFASAGYPPPPPIRDSAYDHPYFQQARHNVYQRIPQLPYSRTGRLEHYTPSEAYYSGRLGQLRSDYTNEVRRDVPYPRRPQPWSDHLYEAHRGAQQPPFYR